MIESYSKHLKDQYSVISVDLKQSRFLVNLILIGKEFHSQAAFAVKELVQKI